MGIFVGKNAEVKETGDIIQINSGTLEEFTGSRYTIKLRGALAKTKANVSQIILELIESATNRRWVPNNEEKHKDDAQKGWYRYDVFFAIPVRAENEEKIRYNTFRATMIVKINNHGMYLYDIIDIKKEASNPEGLNN